MNNPENPASAPGILDCGLTRRQFLFLGAATVGTITLATVLPGKLFSAELASYEGQKIGELSSLRVGEPQPFRYPWDHFNCSSYLIKLGVPAGGGIGGDQDVVAFNTLCPHMGFPLTGTYQKEHQVMGPCPWHLSTYDLTRHGMIVAGHATEGLPQVLLETRGDDIYATGVMALIYGFGDNQVEPGT
jgi:arsenite oxidase small subunit